MRATIFSAVFNAVQWSYASHSGILILNMFNSSIKWFDQPDETVPVINMVQLCQELVAFLNLDG